jgi:type IV fimbrial biogenesis protein FimT
MNSCLSSRVCNGFTLVELLVTISIVAVLLSVGLPSFVTFVSNNQISSATNDLVYSIHMARSEAVKRGAPVRLASRNGSNWNNGWTVQADVNSDGDYADSDDILMQWEPVQGGIDMSLAANNAADDTFIPFNSRGALIPSNAQFSITLTPLDCSKHNSRTISIQPTGRPEMSYGDCS